MATGTKERPILMNGEMVRATLRGESPKTQTRRIVKLPHNNPLGVWEPTVIGGPNGGVTAAGETIPEQGAIWHTRTGDCLACPHGQPGDRLWVRETWSNDFAAHYPYDRVWYAADDDRTHEIEVRDGVRGIYSPESDEHVPFRWHPSIHMPRWASRITLEVTGVRVERLQDISEADAEAEGVHAGSWEYDNGEGTETARESFQCLWDSLNAARGYGWDANPWVWVVKFRRLP
ncbi:hypothetical protein [Paraburkholderia sp. BL17N1]|uniref:hypothetical protein n=1 Tax=Paraburkholderia sp. BL17N1 TaxID=1938798 RepID=UPI000EB09355|nr:hypothetical protein [Paraburkholderia sp. BL17N1]